MTEPPALDHVVVVGLEFDQLSAACEWRWYIEDRSNPLLTITRTGEWRKKRNKAKKELQVELVEKKATKKDPDRVRLDKPWIWGPDRYHKRFDDEANNKVTIKGLNDNHG